MVSFEDIVDERLVVAAAVNEDRCRCERPSLGSGRSRGRETQEMVDMVMMMMVIKAQSIGCG